jgi:predicted unusual protein kinase regulating ubiquinone biosynthesis (AarF/ABC1/UbiB family)
VAKVASSLGELKGLAMKVGQILSYIDVALPEELRAALSVLQTHSPPMPTERVRGILSAELGEGAAELLASLEDTPLAAASIGQVHRARLADGTRAAVKVQYPEVERAIAADFAPAAVGSHLAALFSPGAKVDALVREAR